MPRKRRSGKTELSFDGLTDSVTNLVGALILLVVLIIGVTREAVSQQQPPERNKPAVPKNAGEKSIRPLQDRVNQLNAQINGVDNNIQVLKNELRQLGDEVDELLQKAEKIKNPDVTKRDDDDDQPTRTENYRLPLRRFVQKKHITFVVEDDRVSWMDWGALNKALQQAVSGKSGKLSLDFDVPGTDYKVTGTVRVVRQDGNVAFRDVDLHAVRKPGKTGENAQAAVRSSSRFYQILRSVSPDTHVVRFLVYPDSFDAFRTIRGIAFQKKFRVGWELVQNGDPIRLGRGGGRIGIDN